MLIAQVVRSKRVHAFKFEPGALTESQYGQILNSLEDIYGIRRIFGENRLRFSKLAFELGVKTTRKFDDGHPYPPVPPADKLIKICVREILISTGPFVYFSPARKLQDSLFDELNRWNSIRNRACSHNGIDPLDAKRRYEQELVSLSSEVA